MAGLTEFPCRRKTGEPGSDNNDMTPIQGITCIDSLDRDYRFLRDRILRAGAPMFTEYSSVS